MFKCKGCKREYEDEECFAVKSNDSMEEYKVFDGKAMRDTCPACGALVCEVEERSAVVSAA